MPVDSQQICESNQPDKDEWNIEGSDAKGKPKTSGQGPTAKRLRAVEKGANEGDALKPLDLPDSDPTEADLGEIVDDMMMAVRDGDSEIFEALRELYPRRWLQLAAHEIRKAKPESYAVILTWLTKVPVEIPVITVSDVSKAEEESETDEVDEIEDEEWKNSVVIESVVEVSTEKNTSDFPQVGDLVWRNPIPAKYSRRIKSPFQPGCVCRIVQVTDRGAIAQSELDGSKYHISWHAWQSGIFTPYCEQDSRI